MGWTSTFREVRLLSDLNVPAAFVSRLVSADEAASFDFLEKCGGKRSRQNLLFTSDPIFKIRTVPDPNLIGVSRDEFTIKQVS